LGVEVCALVMANKTALHFVIDPGFILETEYADWKTGNLASAQALAADP
jgi:hypothetical protein